jgi:hypothetical protein
VIVGVDGVEGAAAGGADQQGAFDGLADVVQLRDDADLLTMKNVTDFHFR